MALHHSTQHAAPAAPQRRPPPAGGLQAFVADELGMGALLRFRSLMVQQGQTVQVARMCFDKIYAYERIASAHATESEPLRRLALELFQAYHRRDEMRQTLAS
ncbi:MAG: hypothetical protein C4K60_09460 [Ideonella sp. MAG2]|nr:MAG: hypothetical protein C4K60_09460 [Ideonella sp. MAG2]